MADVFGRHHLPLAPGEAPDAVDRAATEARDDPEPQRHSGERRRRHQSQRRGEEEMPADQDGPIGAVPEQRFDAQVRDPAQGEARRQDDQGQPQRRADDPEHQIAVGEIMQLMDEHHGHPS